MKGWLQSSLKVGWAADIDYDLRPAEKLFTDLLTTEHLDKKLRCEIFQIPVDALSFPLFKLLATTLRELEALVVDFRSTAIEASSIIQAIESGDTVSLFLHRPRGI